MRYKADITAGSLKIPESRIIAGLLLQNASKEAWKASIYRDNVLQTRTLATAKRITRLVRNRLETMNRDLWLLVREGSGTVSTHACLAAAIKHSYLLGDFLDLTLREQHRVFNTILSNRMWDDYLSDCRARDPDMPIWNQSTRIKLRTTVFHILVQAGFIENSKTKKLQKAQIAFEVIDYLESYNEHYVLRCIQVSS